MNNEYWFPPHSLLIIKMGSIYSTRLLTLDCVKH